MAKYNIRQPFAVHLEIFTDTVRPDGTKMRQRTQQSFFPGQSVELTDAQALEHLHKLEPADPAATKFVGAYHARQDAIADARQAAEGPSIGELVAAAVSAELAKRDAAAAGAKK